MFPKFETQLKAKFAYDYTYFNDTVLSQARSSKKYLYPTGSLSFFFQYILQLIGMSVSGDFQYNNLDADLKNFILPVTHALVALATTYQWNRFKFLGSLLGTFTSEKVKMNFKPDDRREWTPAFFMSYQPLQSLNLPLELL
jgi:hypothetical protein